MFCSYTPVALPWYCSASTHDHYQLLISAGSRAPASLIDSVSDSASSSVSSASHSYCSHKAGDDTWQTHQTPSRLSISNFADVCPEPVWAKSSSVSACLKVTTWRIFLLRQNVSDVSHVSRIAHLNHIHIQQLC
jgi:hypothetical protein